MIVNRSSNWHGKLRASFLVFVAAWPTILLLQWLLQPWLERLTPILQAGVLCAVMAPTLTFFAVPWLDGKLPGRKRSINHLLDV